MHYTYINYRLWDDVKSNLLNCLPGIPQAKECYSFEHFHFTLNCFKHNISYLNGNWISLFRDCLSGSSHGMMEWYWNANTFGLEWILPLSPLDSSHALNPLFAVFAHTLENTIFIVMLFGMLFGFHEIVFSPGWCM